MRTLKKGEPAPYAGVLVDKERYYKLCRDEDILDKVEAIVDGDNDDG